MPGDTVQSRRRVKPTPIALEGGAHADEVREFDGLEEKGISAELVGEIHVVQVGRRREDNDRERFERFVGADPADDIETVHDRHLKIHHEERGERVLVAIAEAAFAEEIREHLGAVAHDENGIDQTILAKGPPCHFDMLEIILREEYKIAVHCARSLWRAGRKASKGKKATPIVRCNEDDQRIRHNHLHCGKDKAGKKERKCWRANQLEADKTTAVKPRPARE
jgi:hypothetical protein